MRRLATTLLAVSTLLGCASALPPEGGPGDDVLGEAPPIDGPADSATTRASWTRRQITAWNASLTAEDRDAKFDRMAESPYAFFRGTNHLFWADFARDTRLRTYGGVAATRTWIQGDLHPDNFGAFDDDEGEVVYDLNDFDEAMIADYQLDVWRAATGIRLVAHVDGISNGDADDAVDAFVEAYLDRLDEVRGNDDEVDATFTYADARGKLDDFLLDVELERGRADMLDEWTVVTRGARAFRTDHPELAAASASMRDEITRAMPAYGETLDGALPWSASYFRVKSVARRLDAGIGSLGTPRYYVLLEGPSSSQSDDVILDVKRQGAPTGFRFVTDAVRRATESAFASPAERVVVAQSALLAEADDHLGWMELASGSYSVRERSPFKATLDVEDLDGGSLETMAEQWGEILANAHARGDADHDASLVSRSFEDEVHARADGDHDGFRALVRDVSRTAAAHTIADYATFLAMR